jgi:hypothetical protein
MSQKQIAKYEINLMINHTNTTFALQDQRNQVATSLTNTIEMLQGVENKQKAGFEAIKTMDLIKETHKKVYENLNNLDSKELLKFIREFSGEVITLIEQIKNAFGNAKNA